ncbi:prepilin-type N-terminal cleavage/methylation domain-containing protein [Candidatus Parcubacteria bacterium]|nr:MAG: prepilin-type N-terminal cleavage/methylation domain-containing protein [Candidatus Parcubacteria bacterium]
MRLSITKKTPSAQNGFTLVELIISIAVMGLLVVGIYSLIILSLQITRDNQFYIEATEIANQKMEKIRNLPYDDVGTLTGSPPGVVPEYETIVRSGTFQVHTMIIFYDDPFDGTESSSTDSIPYDYKIVTIEVSWQSSRGPANLTVFSRVIPNTEENISGYGTLKLNIVNADGDPVPNASIHVENSDPLINADYVADTQGKFTLPLKPDLEGYEITVTKTGYGTDKTYTRDVNNPNPSKPHISIFEGQKTEQSFSIDRLGTLTIRTVSADSLPQNWRVSEKNSASDKKKVRFARDGNNYLYFTWEETTATSATVKVRKFDSSGTAQWTNEKTLVNTKFQRNPDIVTTSAGRSYIVWQDNSTTLKNLTLRPVRLAQDTQNASFQPPIALNRPSPAQKTEILPVNLLSKIFSLPSFNIISPLQISWQKLLPWPIYPAQAQGGVNIVQTAMSSNVSWGSSMTATFSSQPQQGNVIIAIAVHRNGGDSFYNPTNSAGSFTPAIYSDTGWSLDVGIWHKVAGASEPNQVTITSTSNINGGVLMIMEVSGLDTSNLVNVTASNDQTGSNSLTATTGNTPQSTDNGFAVAAITFADNDFNTPNSSDWSSGSSDVWTHRLWDDWWQGYDGSLAVATMNVTAAAAQSATLTLSGGGSEQRNSVMVIYNVYDPDDITVSALATQTASMLIPSVNQYLGGTFVITDNTGSHTINSITLWENGTVNAQSDLTNIKLFYDIDSTAPYDCAGEQYDAGIDAQFGATGSFSGSDGTSTFVYPGGLTIDTTNTLCLYVVLDVGSGASNGETINIYFNDPSQDVVIASGNVIPASLVDLDGSTTLNTPANPTQIHYRWRNDDGDEQNASWKELEDTAITITKNDSVRLRLEISNEGGLAAGSAQYRLEYGENTSNCQSISNWQVVPTDSSLDWQIIDSGYFMDNSTTSDLLAGLTNEGTTFKAGYLKDASAQTPNITLGADELTEIEFSLHPTTNADDNNSYCFRVTDNGTPLTYNQYPQISIVGDENIYIISLDNLGGEYWAVKKVNSDGGDTDQINPRLALTERLGQATTSVVWQDNRNGNWDIYLQQFDYAGNKVWSNDILVSGSSTDEITPVIAIDNQDNIIIGWAFDNGGQKDIYLHKFSSTGTPLWSAPHPIAHSSLDEYDPAILTDDSNNIYLTWTENNSGTLNQMIAKAGADGILLWNKRANLENVGDNQSKGALAINSNYLFVAWSDERQGNKDIYAQKYDLSGTAQWSEDAAISIDGTGGEQNQAALLTLTNGSPYGAWQDGREGEFNAYATLFGDPESALPVGNVPITIRGTKRIGEDPIIYEYDTTHTTDASGEITLNLEWDSPGYTIDVNSASSSLSLELIEPPVPISLNPAESKTVLMYIK